MNEYVCAFTFVDTIIELNKFRWNTETSEVDTREAQRSGVKLRHSTQSHVIGSSPPTPKYRRGHPAGHRTYFSGF